MAQRLRSRGAFVQGGLSGYSGPLGGGHFGILPGVYPGSDDHATNPLWDRSGAHVSVPYDPYGEHLRDAAQDDIFDDDNYPAGAVRRGLEATGIPRALSDLASVMDPVVWPIADWTSNLLDHLLP